MTTEARIADLERRLSLLEQGKHGSIIRGWGAAARVLGVTDSTVHRWYKTDPKFPKPVRVRYVKCGVKPEWRFSDLTLYRN